MQGQLFSQEFLLRGVRETPPYQAPFVPAQWEATLRQIYTGLDAESTINEAQTESLIIDKMLSALGWDDAVLPQVNLSSKGREDVPDYLLFPSGDKKALALAERKDDQRYRHGIAILEAKRWMRPMDRGDRTEFTDPSAPSSQMLRYLSRSEVISNRAVQWGILTNGNIWRLYWQGARSRSEEFLEVDVAAALGLNGFTHTLDGFDAENSITPSHALHLFFLFFHRNAFLSQSWDTEGRSFHAYALHEARLYEETVSHNLGERVFSEVFPQLANAIAIADVHTASNQPPFTSEYLDEVREATLVFLYRLLFLFYAEDRNLLPIHDERYNIYSVRRIRQAVREKIDASKPFSNTIGSIWCALQDLSLLIDQGDDTIGMPAYNGGLFNQDRSSLLARTRVSDKVMAPIVDALSRRTEDAARGWVNYRDLAVAHLGSIYERLLDYSLVWDDTSQRLITMPSSFARKVSGSYYTHDDLVRLILQESVGKLARRCNTAFTEHLQTLGKKRALNPADWEALDNLDPASHILELKICDPAMGSGHFLVALVDYVADRVLESIARSAEAVNQQPWAARIVELGRAWESPVLARISHIRTTIQKTAQTHGWAVTKEQLDDRHIVRRMVLKKTIFGVDKNPMAVELAKTALWLHTFTVGAPLSFLDHHLKIGDSLHGEQLSVVQKNLQALGSLLLQSDFDRLSKAAENIAHVADLTDVDIAEAHLSRQLATEANAQIAPIRAVLDFWRALRWLVPGWPVSEINQLSKLLPPVDGKIHPILEGLTQLLAPNHNLVQVLGAGVLEGCDAANALMAQARQLAKRETFFHWWITFQTAAPAGFDAVIGNPPWDRIKLQEVEWFAERNPTVAAQTRASDRKKMIAALRNTPLGLQYQDTCQRAETNARVLGNGKHGSGEYPLLGGGDVNLYSLFVERAQSLINPQGIVALVTPSGIAADKGAAPFFRSISSTGRLYALFDFENRKYFFPDVDSRFKFCVLVFGNVPSPDPTHCAFFLHSLYELENEPGRTLFLTHEDFARVNPNTGAAPIFRNHRNAELTLRMYAQHPILVKHGVASDTLGKQSSEKVWRVKYQRMFDMTNDSHLFLKKKELDELLGKQSSEKVWAVKYATMFHMTNDSHLFAKKHELKGKDESEFVPLYEGKMVQMFDHRAADVVVNSANLHRPAQQEAIPKTEKINPDRYPTPQYWVNAKDVDATWKGEWGIAYKSVTAPSNMRTMIAAMVPRCGVGNSMAMLLPESDTDTHYADWASLLLANFNAIVFDFVLRQKVQGQNLNWFIVEQAPVIAPHRFDALLPSPFTAAMRKAKLLPAKSAAVTVADFVRFQVLALTYTAHDMAAFACDMGYVDESGLVLAPFTWNEEERRNRQAALDAVFFWLYGMSRDDAAYILDTFPIIREQDVNTFGHFKTQEDILAMMQNLVPILEN